MNRPPGNHGANGSFTDRLLDDIRALERMLEEGRIEADVRRIGAEQEIFLVDHAMRPVLTAMEVLERTGDARLTTELGRFNLEMNLTPLPLHGDCFRRMREELEGLLTRTCVAANEVGTRILLTGILPTLRQADLSLESMTPRSRYRELNDASVTQRGGRFRMLIKGLDELSVVHDNVMFEACNTSFQVHFQVGADEFARLYNLAQAITAPVLAVAVNSPVFLQHRLWSETRMALFRQSVDTRSDVQRARQAKARVIFGDRWVESSVLEIFRDDIARFRVFLTGPPTASSLEVLDRGQVPALDALCLHNGTVYRWNRPCYGVLEGKPHLRIEHRAMPSGPTVVDEIANAALFFGLMTALSHEIGDITRVMEFDDAKRNFLAAARHGLNAQFEWSGRTRAADDVLLHDLLPLARAGLEEKSVAASDIDLYLGLIEDRTRRRQTGAQWTLDSLATMQGQAHRPECYRALTACMHRRQKEGRPVHEWPLASLQEAADGHAGCRLVEQIMTVDLFTVRSDDLVDLAANLMDWRHIRHVPVEDDRGRLIGLVSHRQLLRVLARGVAEGETVAVREIMTRDPLTVCPETSTRDAVELMRRNAVSCLPVVERDGTLVGILTERDLILLTARLLEELGGGDADPCK